MQRTRSLALALSLAASFPFLAEGATPTQSGKLEVKEWFALGSGCRARFNQPGDVTFSISPHPSQTSTTRLQFRLPNYALDGTKPIRADHPTFARECALRMSVFPAPGTRIREIRNAAALTIRKDLGVKLQISTQMLLGDLVIAQKQIALEKERNLFQHREDLSLVANSLADSNAACGVPRVLGVDLSLTNYRDNGNPPVLAKLINDGEVSLEIVTETCANSKKD